ncbi:TRAP transporter large permease subunit [Vibrio sp. PP-XX7]
MGLIWRTSVMTATAGSIGIIIPPSIPSIDYFGGNGLRLHWGGYLCGGVIPGILMGCALMVVQFCVLQKSVTLTLKAGANERNSPFFL